MEYDFYQRLIPINKLIHVGKYYVPNGKPTWHIPLMPEISVKSSADIFTSAQPIYEEITYHRVALGYVADVKIKGLI